MAEFSLFISKLGKGNVELALSAALKSVAAAVRDNGGKGRLTFTIDLSRSKKDPSLFACAHDIKTKLPEAARLDELFFLKDESRLIALADTQMQLNFGQPLPEPKTIELPPPANKGPEDKE
jgi:hypothetical protein